MFELFPLKKEQKQTKKQEKMYRASQINENVIYNSNNVANTKASKKKLKSFLECHELVDTEIIF